MKHIGDHLHLKLRGCNFLRRRKLRATAAEEKGHISNDRKVLKDCTWIERRFLSYGNAVCERWYIFMT